MRPMTRVLGRLALSLLPLSMTPFIGFGLADGYINLGGGCKDILGLIPWILWSLAYFLFFIVFWRKKFTLIRTTAYAAAGATGILALLFFLLLFWQFGSLGLKAS